jgi:hypothetical protein
MAGQGTCPGKTMAQGTSRLAGPTAPG